MYLIILLLASATLTLFVASKITQFFLAGRPELKWIIIAALASATIALTTYIGLNFIVAWIDLSATDATQTLTKLHPTTMFVITVSVMLLLSSTAFKIINQMDWGSALVTNIASVAILLLTSMGSLSLIENNTKTERFETASVAPLKQKVVVDETIAKLVKP